jgi:hypothetical protein
LLAVFVYVLFFNAWVDVVVLKVWVFVWRGLIASAIAVSLSSGARGEREFGERRKKYGSLPRVNDNQYDKVRGRPNTSGNASA